MSQYQRREDLTIIPELLGLAAKEGQAVGEKSIAGESG